MEVVAVFGGPMCKIKYGVVTFLPISGGLGLPFIPDGAATWSVPDEKADDEDDATELDGSAAADLPWYTHVVDVVVDEETML